MSGRSESQLTILDHFPQKALFAPANRFHELFDGPTLVHIKGVKERPLFVSILLHGNEITGVQAIQTLLRNYGGKSLPRALSIFIGNVEAAAHGKRRLDHQPDYNRIWGCDESHECEWAGHVMEEMISRDIFASLDLHNNTGLNPHFSCVSTFDNRSLFLATAFDRLVVNFKKPDTTLTNAFSKICPAMSAECGLPNQARGATHAAEFVEYILHLSDIPDRPIPASDIELYHSEATVKLAQSATAGFDGDHVDMIFRPDLDHLNFQPLESGVHLGSVNGKVDMPLIALNDDGVQTGDLYFKLEDGLVKLKRQVMPAMLTKNTEIILQDCLCYLLERINYNT